MEIIKASDITSDLIDQDKCISIYKQAIGNINYIKEQEVQEYYRNNINIFSENVKKLEDPNYYKTSKTFEINNFYILHKLIHNVNLDGLLLTGGILTTQLFGKDCVQDIDIFGTFERSKSFIKDLSKCFEIVYYIKTKVLLNIYIKDHEKVLIIQYIIRNNANSKQNLIEHIFDEHYDFEFNKLFIQNKKVMLPKNSLDNILYMYQIFKPFYLIKDLYKIEKRVNKYLKRGFNFIIENSKIESSGLENSKIIFKTTVTEMGHIDVESERETQIIEVKENALIFKQIESNEEFKQFEVDKMKYNLEILELLKTNNKELLPSDLVNNYIKIVFTSYVNDYYISQPLFLHGIDLLKDIDKMKY